MRYTYIIGMALAALTLTTTSCGDDLNELPSQQKVDGNLVVDLTSAKAAVNGIYYQFAICGTDNYSVKSTGCSSIYEIFPADLAGTAEYYQGPYMFETHGAYVMGMYGSYIWSPYYQTIAAANAVIEQIESAPDSYFHNSEKQELLGQAYGMRALGHYNILRYFGYSWDLSSPYGAILRTEKSVATKLPKARSTVSETYDLILSDLDYAIQNASASVENYQFGQWAAKGLKARVLMMRGQSADYAEAASICQDIIQNSPYALDDYESIFHQKGLASSDVIFGIQPKDNQTNVYETYYYRGSAQYFPTNALMALYDLNGDPRKDQMYLGSLAMQIGWNADGTYYIYYDTKYTICKHLDPAKATDNAGVVTFVADDTEETQYQLRMAEIYLLRAEALARMGQLSEAKQLLRQVEEKAGITDFTSLDAAETQTAVLEQIFYEALKNLSFECGLEHNYMLRFPQDIVLKFNPVYATTETNVFGLPTDEFQYNNALTAADQNPGYSAE